jgi:hypothetical protein
MQTRGVHWFPPSNSRNYLALGIVTAVENAIDSQFYRIVFRATYGVAVPIALAAVKTTQPTANSLPKHVNKLVRAVIHEFLSAALGPRSDFIAMQREQLKSVHKLRPAVPSAASPATDKEVSSPWSQWLLSELWRSFFTTVGVSERQLRGPAWEDSDDRPVQYFTKLRTNHMSQSFLPTLIALEAFIEGVEAGGASAGGASAGSASGGAGGPAPVVVSGRVSGWSPSSRPSTATPRRLCWWWVTGAHGPVAAPALVACT